MQAGYIQSRSMKRHVDGNRWWGIIAWSTGAPALTFAAWYTARPSTTILVALLAALMVLVQLRWRVATRHVHEEREERGGSLRPGQGGTDARRWAHGWTS